MITFDSGSPYDIFPPWADSALAELGYPSQAKAKECPNGVEEFGQLSFVIGGVEYTYEPNEWVDVGSASLHQLQEHHSNVFGPKLPAGKAPEKHEAVELEDDEEGTGVPDEAIAAGTAELLE